MNQELKTKTPPICSTIKSSSLENIASVSSEQITHDLLPKQFGNRGMIWVIALVMMCLIGAFAYMRQLEYGLGVTNMGDYVSWGIYISNFGRKTFLRGLGFTSGLGLRRGESVTK